MTGGPFLIYGKEPSAFFRRRGAVYRHVCFVEPLLIYNKVWAGAAWRGAERKMQGGAVGTRCAVSGFFRTFAVEL